MAASNDPKDGDRDASRKDERKSRPPTSAFGRFAKLSQLAPRAFPMATEVVRRVTGVERSLDEEAEAQRKLLASAKKTAEAMLKTLGEMKGLPLKLGQMASYIDGLAPPGYEDKFQRVLTQLQAKAPPLSPRAAVRVVTEELGSAPETVFREWTSEPFAAASIGQVHRAVTRAGDLVAVKVQYPGIDKAIENDLKSLGMLESMISPLGRRYQTKETLDEVRAVFMAELDYTHEAEMADTFRRIHEADPDIVIPRVHHWLTTRRVLTVDFVEGVDYQSFSATASKDERDRAGQTIWRFMFRALYKHGILYADPHPGNYRFLGNGRVAFLDFGCTKVLPLDLVEGMKRCVVYAQEENWDAFMTECESVLGFDPSDPQGFELYTNYTKMVLTPQLQEAPFTFTHEFAREAVQYLVRHGKKLVLRPDEKLPTLPKPIRMPPDHTFVNRLQWGLVSVLAGLEAEGNWRTMTSPWLRERTIDREA